MSNELLDPGREAKFGVPPGRIVDYLALVGDTSTTFPGVAKRAPRRRSNGWPSTAAWTASSPMPGNRRRGRRKPAPSGFSASGQTGHRRLRPA